MNSRAGSFASLACTRREIEKLLVSQIERFCAGGREFVRNHRDTIHRTAFATKLKIGNVNLFKYARPFPGSGSVGSLVIHRTPLEARRICLEKAMRGLPSEIAATKAYDRLEAAVRSQELTIDRTKKADQAIIYRLRKKVGYRVRNVNGVQTWQKL